jgi:hypothetical protein
MNSYGKRLFYVNKPQISDRQTFSSQCKDAEQTIVLGCYNGINIYIFKVEDQNLEGVQQVTAAHEMLHAAYNRLSSSEKTRIDKLVANAFAKVTNQRVRALADSYNKQAPGSVPNELHSILATEVRDVGVELEEYYKKYFTNRAAVVAFSEKYEKVFEDIKRQVDKYDADLALRKTEIDSRESELKALENQLTSMRNQMEAYQRAGQIRNYNAMVSTYNQKVNEYNYGVEEVRGLISEYNKLVEARNKLAIQQQSLAKSIDSRLNTIEE